MGLRYQRLVPSCHLASLPPAAQSALALELDHFHTIPRGGVRAHNDATFDARARHFRDWLPSFGYTDELLACLTPEQAIATLALFLLHCAKGDNIQGRSDLHPKTITGYLRSAAAYLEVHSGVPAPLFADSKGKTWHPLLAEVLAQRRNWGTPKPRKEPVTSLMFETMHSLSQVMLAEQPSASLQEFCALMDWCLLGTHTGSRLGEYGQSTGGCLVAAVFARVPASPDAGEWAGSPLASMTTDFVFYNADRVLIPIAALLRRNSPIPAELHIRFRYDKSPVNHTWRRFCALPDNFFCPVTRGLSIIRRAAALGIPVGFPIGAYLDASGAFRYITGSRMSLFLKRICVATYPDASHYMRRHIDGLVSHSMRVTACVALAAAGMDHEEIAFRLRWTVPSVRFYLRDSVADIGRFTKAAVRGALALV